MSNKIKELNFETLKNPPSEKTIMTHWEINKPPKVSIDMLVYNHENYLKDAINSILNQKTKFAFELLIHDDASTDSSAKIIKEFEVKYPNIIKPIYQKENQYSKNINPAMRFNYNRANSDYLAICEGDDFWTDTNKLQTQIDVLEANPEINMCFHKAFELDYIYSVENINIIGEYSDRNCETPFTDILFLTKGMIPTASCVVRYQQKENTRNFIDARSYLTLGDLYMQFFGSYPNGAYYINTPMSFYRKRTENSWTLNITKDTEFKHKHEIAMLISYIELNKLTNKNYEEKFSALILQRLLWIFRPEPEFKNSLIESILDVTEKQEESKQFIPNLYKHFQGCQNEIYKTLKKWESLEGNKVIYGAGSGCKLILECLGAFNIEAIIDRDRKRVGKTINRTKIIDEKYLSMLQDVHLLISTPSADKNHILKLAETANIPRNNVHFLFENAIQWILKNEPTIQI